MKQVTLIFLKKGKMIALSKKKRGFGKDFWNGYGGKLEPEETVEQAAIREIKEEADVTVNVKDLHKIGEVVFKFKVKPEWNQNVHWFFVENYLGNPKETEEMSSVTWFPADNLPYSEMWPADAELLEHMLKGEFVHGEVLFAEDGQYEYIKLSRPIEILMERK